MAGIFYPADAEACRQLASSYVRPADAGAQIAAEKKWLGGIVPHAGWICSGAVAGQTIATIVASWSEPVDLVIVFGAVHTPLPISIAALDSHAWWLMPGGEVRLPQELERKLIEVGGLFQTDDRFHLQEHAVEVELPLIRQAWPEASVVPIEVPLIDNAIQIGIHAAREAMALHQHPVFLASSDLTHYGVNYGFAPAGLGPSGLAWASGNDRRLLDRVSRFEVEQIVPEVRGHSNACGGGAIAAMLAACREFGANEGRVIRQTNSYQTLAGVAPQSSANAVGYAAVVVG